MRGLRFIAVTALACVAAPSAWACAWCRADVREAVYAPGFASTTLLLLLPLVVIALVGVGLHFADGRGPLSRTDDSHGNDL